MCRILQHRTFWFIKGDLWRAKATNFEVRFLCATPNGGYHNSARIWIEKNSEWSEHDPNAKHIRNEMASNIFAKMKILKVRLGLLRKAPWQSVGSSCGRLNASETAFVQISSTHRDAKIFCMFFWMVISVLLKLLLKIARSQIISRERNKREQNICNQKYFFRDRIACHFGCTCITKRKHRINFTLGSTFLERKFGHRLASEKRSKTWLGAMSHESRRNVDDWWRWYARNDFMGGEGPSLVLAWAQAPASTECRFLSKVQ